MGNAWSSFEKEQPCSHNQLYREHLCNHCRCMTTPGCQSAECHRDEHREYHKGRRSTTKSVEARQGARALSLQVRITDPNDARMKFVFESKQNVVRASSSSCIPSMSHPHEVEIILALTGPRKASIFKSFLNIILPVMISGCSTVLNRQRVLSPDPLEVDRR